MIAKIFERIYKIIVVKKEKEKKKYLGPYFRAIYKKQETLKLKKLLALNH